MYLDKSCCEVGFGFAILPEALATFRFQVPISGRFGLKVLDYYWASPDCPVRIARLSGVLDCQPIAAGLSGVYWN